MSAMPDPNDEQPPDSATAEARAAWHERGCMDRPPCGKCAWCRIAAGIRIRAKRKAKP